MKSKVKVSSDIGGLNTEISQLSYLLRRLERKPHVQQDLCSLLAHPPYFYKLIRVVSVQPERGELRVIFDGDSQEMNRLERACAEENLTPLLIEEGLLEAQEENFCVPAGTEVKVGPLKFVLEADAVVKGYARNLKSLGPDIALSLVDPKCHEPQR